MCDEYPKQRNLDGVYFRVERNGKYRNVCFSDMTEEERRRIDDMKTESAKPEERAEWWFNMTNIMANRLRELGDQLGIVCE